VQLQGLQERFDIVFQRSARGTTKGRTEPAFLQSLAAIAVIFLIDYLARTMQRPPTQRDEAAIKKKDVWDKAQIMSGFIASVVIAAVGLLINSSIQRA
jgi:hypothetical protein